MNVPKSVQKGLVVFVGVEIILVIISFFMSFVPNGSFLSAFVYWHTLIGCIGLLGGIVWGIIVICTEIGD